MTYQVRVSRENQWWVAEVDGMPAAATETRRLADLDAEVRDLLAGLLEVDEESLTIHYDFSQAFGTTAAEAWEQFVTERDELYRRQQQLEHDRSAIVRTLRDHGVSTRDVGKLVGLSHQRVSQLLDT